MAHYAIQQDVRDTASSSRTYTRRDDRGESHNRLFRDYFAEEPKFNEIFFRNRFRMSRRLFVKIASDLENNFSFFKRKIDAHGRWGFSGLQRCTSAVRQLGYGSNPDSLDDYLNMSERSSRETLNAFCDGLIKLYRHEYLRRPTRTDTQRILDHHASYHGFLGMLVNNSAVVRSGLAQPTVMGTPVLAEDLYAQPAAMGTPVLAEDLYAPPHSDIVDPPMRSFSQWEEEEGHGDPPPLSTAAYGTHPENLSQFGHHSYHPDASRQQLDSSVDQEMGIDKEPCYPTGTAPMTGYATHFKENDAVTDPYDLTADSTTGYATRFDAPDPQPQRQSIDVYTTHPAGDHAYKQDVDTDQSRTVMEEDTSGPNPTMKTSPGNYQTKVTDPTNTGGKEATGITDVLHTFDKMKVFEEPHPQFTKPEQGKTEVFTGSHDQFAPEPVEKHPPLDTISSDPSNPNSIYTQKITSATSAIGQKAAAMKDTIISKFSSSDEDKTDIGSEPQKTKTKLSSATDYAHVVADTLSGTLGPVYEKMADAGTSVMSKIQGSGHDESVTSPSGTSKGATVKEYLTDAFKPGDDDKVLSEKITSVFNRGKANEPQETTTTKTTTYVIKDEGERRLQDSDN